MDQKDALTDRRGFLVLAGRCAGLAALGALAFPLARNRAWRKNSRMVWQIDPSKCVQCGACATECVLSPSAVKCVHVFAKCGYCDLCGGYFQPEAKRLDTSAENALCPTDAIKRTFIEHPYYEYTIDEELCIGCAKCVKGCQAFGNGSLILQVRHDRCLNCDDCAIARACPSNAFTKVPADSPAILGG
jgi:electron transport complex protein RnfB